MDETIHLKISKTIEDLIPSYLDNRKKDIVSLNNALDQENLDFIQGVAHKLKGSGGGYGFDAISDIGRTMEISAKEKNKKKIKDAINALTQYLENICITYE